MAMILKNLTFGEFTASMSSSLYNTGTVAVTAASAVTILAGQPIAAAGPTATAPLGIAFESVELAAGETYNVAALTNGGGVVLNMSKLKDRHPTYYPAAQTALEAMGFVFKE